MAPRTSRSGMLAEARGHRKPRVAIIVHGRCRFMCAELLAELLRAARAGAIPKHKLFDELPYLERRQWRRKAQELRRVIGDATVAVALPVSRPLRVGKPDHHPRSAANRRRAK